MTETPVRVPLHTRPLGIWGSLQAGRRNVLELIPQIATEVPILSGKTGKRWHMVMDPRGAAAYPARWGCGLSEIRSDQADPWARHR